MKASFSLFALLGVLWGAIALPLSAQELRANRYELLTTPFIHPVSIAATPDALFAIVGGSQIHRSSDGRHWERIAPDQIPPPAILAHAGAIHGLRDGQLLKLEAGAWIVLSACEGSLKSQHGYLYNHRLVSGSLSLRRSLDGVTWEDLPSFANFSGLVGNLFDLAANEETIVVTGHSGRFLLKQGAGPWTVKTSGSTDRLYSALLSKGRLVIGGTGGLVHVSSDLDTFTPLPGIDSLRHLSSAGGVVLGCGGFNPAGGQLFYSNDFEHWHLVEGPPVGAVSQAATLGAKIYFLTTIDGVGRLLTSDYSAPTPRLESGDTTRRISIRRVGAANHRLQVSADLSAWTEPPGATRQETAEEISWQVPANAGAGGAAEFFRVLID